MRTRWQLRPCKWHRASLSSVGHLKTSNLRCYSCNCVPSNRIERPTQEADKASTKDSRHSYAINSPHEYYTAHSFSPGSPLFQPAGTHVLQKLRAFLRAQYPSYGFEEVLTPNMYKKSLWETSGHWENYKDDMFAVTGRGAQGFHDPESETGEDEEYGLKPMNCPGHCLLFRSRKRSYKDLPIRYADFSSLHRNELSGALSGLTRLRRFHQDDGHIFCGHSQLMEEIARSLHFVELVYRTLGLGNYKLRLGTRPPQFIGTVDDWETAERHLTTALEDSGRSYCTNPGDGAFYGPKIDIVLTDADGKDHQTATIQLDFQLPKRFGLEFDTSEPAVKQTPVLIHRAVLGSLERFMALLSESYCGKWPCWMNPRQLIILTIGQEQRIRRRAEEMVRQLASPDARPGALALKARAFMVSCDNSDESIGKKIFNARKRGYNFYAVVGDRTLRQPPNKQTLDISLASHPKEQDVQEAIKTFLHTQTVQAGSETQIEPATSKAVIASLTIRQCQDLLTYLDSQYL
ncbi:MAG: hypothetical protein L6R35_000441 [Caloplaca aegaea]|nr:MAG: hypothetical protein L6R35_000441 [Caloplaca aegaea]